MPLKRANLSLDDKEALAELLDIEGYRVFVLKIIPALVESKRERLLSQSLTEPDSFQKLALTRAEIDGAKQLAADIIELRKYLKSLGN